MQKKKSNIKRMGVKSIHYSNNNVIVEDSLTADPTVIYNVEYDNIEDLYAAQKIDGCSRGANAVSFEDIPNKRGFKLGKVLDKQKVSAIVDSVKTVSYVQKLFDITSDNNFEIQIYHNYEDIKKLIANYCNHVIYSLNSMSKVDITNSKIFDNIGNLQSNYFFENFRQEKTKIDDLGVLISAMQDVLIKYGIETKDRVKTRNKSISEILCLQYVRKILKMTYGRQKIETTLSNKVVKVLDDAIHKYRSQFAALCNIRANEVCEDLRFIPLADYDFDLIKNPKNRQKNIKQVNAWLRQQEPFIMLSEDLKQACNEIEPCKETEVVYDYLRLLSLIRNFVVHNSIDLNNVQPETFSLISLAENDIKNYIEKFSKNNAKYINILKSIFKQKDIVKDFFHYSIFGSIKNLGISIEKIRKYILMMCDAGDGAVPNSDRAEYLNKYRVMLGFVLYEHYKNSVNIDSIIVQLKETATDGQKEDVYMNLARGYIAQHKDDIVGLQNIIKKNLGKQVVKDIENLDLNIDTKAYCTNKFVNMLYVFARFLNKKDANNLFAQIINKCESILQLKQVSENMGIKINTATFKEMQTVIPYDGDIGAVIKQLEILRSMCVNSSKRSSDNIKTSATIGDFESAIDCFNKGTYTIEKLKQDITLNERGFEAKQKETKPLKQFLRNNIIVSKQFQYLRKYTDTKICGDIMQNNAIVRFAMGHMLGIDLDNVEDKFDIVKDKEGIYKYVSKVYNDFYKTNLNESMSDYYIDKVKLDNLIVKVTTFTFDKLVDAIFGRITDYNYTALVRLYLTICYTVVKGIMAQNSAYFVAIQDYDRYNVKFRINDKDVNMRLVDDYVVNAPSKTSRSYKQLVTLLGKEYISNKDCDYVHSDAYNSYVRKYRNIVEHCDLLSRNNVIGACSVWKEPIKRVTSYFALYQTLIQRLLQHEVHAVWGKKADTYFALDIDKTYSTKLCIATNMFLSYNMSRFNNLTIEKYAIRK